MLAYSFRRAMLLNSAGHVIFELHLEQTLGNNPPQQGFAVELFERGGNLWTCIAKDYMVLVYKDFDLFTSINIGQNDASFKPLEMVLLQETSELMLVI